MNAITVNIGMEQHVLLVMFQTVLSVTQQYKFYLFIFIKNTCDACEVGYKLNSANTTCSSIC